MADVLEAHGVKFNRDDLLWTVSLADAGIDELIRNHAPNSIMHATQLMFLERGTEEAGFRHIMHRHGKDFQKQCQLNTEQEVLAYIIENIRMGHCATYGFRKDQKRGGFEVVYMINENKFLYVVFGENGFIVTAYLNDDSMSHVERTTDY